MYIRDVTGVRNGERVMAKPVKIKKWGNSLAIRIPYYVAHQIGVKEGDTVRMIVHHNTITISAPINEQHIFAMTIDSMKFDD